MAVPPPRKVKITPKRRLWIDPLVYPAFVNHRLAWSGCTRCPLGSQVQNHCLVRGKLPADVLFIGEAPGTSEDSIGYPFVGPSGDELDKLLDGFEHRYCITNVIACYPRQDGDGYTGQVRQPTAKEAKACHPRLLELKKICNPKVVVYIGRVSAAHRLPNSNAKNFKSRDALAAPQLHKTYDVPHPSAWLQAKGIERQAMMDRFSHTLTEISEYLHARRVKT